MLRIDMLLMKIIVDVGAGHIALFQETDRTGSKDVRALLAASTLPIGQVGGG